MMIVNVYFDIIHIFHAYPDECKNILMYLFFQQFLFVMFNIFILGHISDKIDTISIFLIDLGWQMFLSIHLVNNLHYVLIKNEIEN